MQLPLGDIAAGADAVAQQTHRIGELSLDPALRDSSRFAYQRTAARAQSGGHEADQRPAHDQLACAPASAPAPSENRTKSRGVTSCSPDAGEELLDSRQRRDGAASFRRH